MNSLSRKHFLRLALAVVAVAAAGSAPNVFAAEDIVEITVAHPYGKIFRPIHQKIIKEFNKIHPNVKVRLETPFPDYEELTQRTLAGIAQGNAPVLSFQGINQIRQYIEMGAAYDLSEFVKNDPRWKDGSGSAISTASSTRCRLLSRRRLSTSTKRCLKKQASILRRVLKLGLLLSKRRRKFRRLVRSIPVFSMIIKRQATGCGRPCFSARAAR